MVVGAGSEFVGCVGVGGISGCVCRGGCVWGGVFVGSCVSIHRGNGDSMRPVYEFPPLGVDGRLYCTVWLVGGWSKDRVTRYVNTYTYV